MNEKQAVGGTSGKKRSQDLLGFLLVLVGGFFGVSILFGLVGFEPKGGILTDPILGLVRFLGEWPGLIMTLGWAILGIVLFLKPKGVQPIPPFFAISGLALGASLLLGPLASRGGTVGDVLPSTFGGSTGHVVGIALGSICVWIGVGLLLVGRARPRSSKPESVEPVLGRGREADTDGVSPDEAAALGGQIRTQERGPASPRANPKHAARGSRVRPLDATPLEPIDAAAGSTPRPIEREAEASASSPRALARPPAEPARADLAPASGVSEHSESPADLLARIALENRERSRTLKADPSVRLLDPPSGGSGAASNAKVVDLPFAPSWEGLAEDAEADAVLPEEVDATLEAELDAEFESDLDGSAIAGAEEPTRSVPLFQTNQPWAEELPSEAEDEPTELDSEEEIGALIDDAEALESPAVPAEHANHLPEAEPTEAGASSNLPRSLLGEDSDIDDPTPLEGAARALASADAEEEGREKAANSTAELVPARSRFDQKSLFDERTSARASREASGPMEPKVPNRNAREESAAIQKSGPERIPGEGLEAPRADASNPRTSHDGPIDPASAERAYVLTPAASDPDSAFRRLVFDAGCLVLEENRVAVSMLQRRFELDFDQACAVLDRMQAEGLIGAYMGGRTRDILLSREEWLSKLGSHSSVG